MILVGTQQSTKKQVDSSSPESSSTLVVNLRSAEQINSNLASLDLFPDFSNVPRPLGGASAQLRAGATWTAHWSRSMKPGMQPGPIM